MEKLTISRLGEPKTINYTNKKTGQPDSFQKIGFQTEEHEGRWFDFTFRGSHGLEVGKDYDFEVSSRDYNGKTYYDAKMPKKDAVVDAKMEQVLNKLAKIDLKLGAIWEAVKPEPKKDVYPVNDVPEPFPDDDEMEVPF